MIQYLQCPKVKPAFVVYFKNLTKAFQQEVIHLSNKSIIQMDTKSSAENHQSSIKRLPHCSNSHIVMHFMPGQTFY